MPVLRINERDPSAAALLADWPSDGPTGEITAKWPVGVRLYELRVVTQPDEPPDADPQARVRELLSRLLTSLTPPGQRAVMRVDGALAGVATALTWAASGVAIAASPVRRFDADDSTPTTGSFRAAVSPDDVTALLTALREKVATGVRVRLHTVPADLVSPLLDIDEPSDERWPEILNVAAMGVELLPQGQGMVILTPVRPEMITQVLAT